MIRRLMILRPVAFVDLVDHVGPGGRLRRAATQRPLRFTDWRAEGTQGAVAAGGRDAVAAGFEILKNGGNAADSAAATIFALSVTDSRLFCFGGEVPILVYDAQHQAVTVIAGQGAAPRLATLEHFKGTDGIPARGIEAAAVPAALDACLTLLDRFGTMTFTQVIAPTQALLRRPARPAPWHADLARTLEILVDAEAQGASRRFGPSAGRPHAGAATGGRCVLPRTDRPPHRRLVERSRRLDPLRRPGHPHDPHRGARRRQYRGLTDLQVRRLDAGPLFARGSPNSQGHRPEGDGA